MIVKLPWPPSGLNPNARLHRMAVAKLKATYRAVCADAARFQGGGKIEADALTLRLTFVPPDRRHRDLDNMLSSIKAGLDGLADVLQVNDRSWSLALERSKDVGGFVQVAISAAQEAA